MTIWERLGIGRTEDIKLIKRAYAKQLKKHHPEDDPEGYQALREAFDAAVSYAKKHALRIAGEAAASAETADARTEQARPAEAGLPRRETPATEQTAAPPRIRLWPPSEYEEADAPGDAPEPVLPPPRLHQELPGNPHPVPDGPLTVEDFIASAAVLYDDFPSRISTAKWLELLDSDIMWNMEAKQVIGRRLLELLQTRRFLPPEVWRLLENSFGWAENLREAAQYERGYFADSFLSYYIRQLQEPGLRYEFLLRAEGIDIDRFLFLRDEGRHALARNELKTALKFLKQAHDIFADDPDLLRLLGERYLRIDDTQKALAYFDRLIELVPDEIDGYLYRIRIWRLTNQPERMIEECRFILSRWPNHNEALILQGIAHQMLGDRGSAAESFRQAVQINDLDGRAADRLTEASISGSRNNSWRFYLNRHVLLYLSVSVLTALSLLGCLLYYWAAAHAGTPVIMNGLPDAETLDGKRYVQLEVSNIRDLNLGMYARSDEDYAFQNEDYAYVHYMDYGDPEYTVYLGEFLGKPLILAVGLAAKAPDDAALENLKGYVRELEPELQAAVLKMLLWKPSFDDDSLGALLESYRFDLGSASLSGAEALPEFQPFYLEVAGPQTASPVIAPNLMLFGFLAVLWIYSVYRLAFEYRKIRGIRRMRQS